MTNNKCLDESEIRTATITFFNTYSNKQCVQTAGITTGSLDVTSMAGHCSQLN